MRASFLAMLLASSPVVVELFTSQGCSSCPPADELLSKVRSQPGVIALAYHVDYWDHLGWRDPFSSKKWSKRQLEYVRHLQLSSAYTPQMVVNGTTQFVGSRQGALSSAIEDGSRRAPVGTIQLEASRSGSNITAIVHVTAPPNYDVMLALVQNDASTDIKAGENEGRHANDDAVVRKLERVGKNATVTWPVDATWKNVVVVAFLQERRTLVIANAAVATP